MRARTVVTDAVHRHLWDTIWCTMEEAVMEAINEAEIRGIHDKKRMQRLLVAVFPAIASSLLSHELTNKGYYDLRVTARIMFRKRGDGTLCFIFLIGNGKLVVAKATAWIKVLEDRDTIGWLTSMLYEVNVEVRADKLRKHLKEVVAR